MGKPDGLEDLAGELPSCHPDSRREE
jgi:hypothetical protein